MQEDKRFVQLWKKREVLTETEWGELYKLIFGILNRCYPSILRSLPETKEYYIQEFFLFKVFEPAKHATASPYGESELCRFYKNYLIDVYRGADLEKTDFVEDYDEVERSCADTCDYTIPADGEFFEYGLSYQDVHRHARDFLAQLDETGRVYLALHACADESEPLSRLGKRLRIPSYHYRAQKLGITREKGEIGDDYETTQIGGWLAKVLGLKLSANKAVLTALKILCLESLLQYPNNGGLE